MREDATPTPSATPTRSRSRSSGPSLAALEKVVSLPFWGASLRLGKHWQLEDAEATLIASELKDCIATLPAGTSKRFFKLLETAGPWIGLATALSVATYPRYIETLQLMAEVQRINAARANTYTNATGAGGNVAQFPGGANSESSAQDDRRGASDAPEVPANGGNNNADLTSTKTH